jgi:hypothetical protein
MLSPICSQFEQTWGWVDENGLVLVSWFRGWFGFGSWVEDGFGIESSKVV